MNEIAHSVHLLIVDDYPIFREGLRLLEAEREFRTVGEAAYGEEGSLGHGG